MTAEAPAPDIRLNWLTTHNRLLEEAEEMSFQKGEVPFIGKACGKSLYIADSTEQKRGCCGICHSHGHGGCSRLIWFGQGQDSCWDF